ncbi:hypothetical protein GALMADRAFT_142699 [Galerina marginata CBS 339.88]|uniref:F-box domain-containing protein n=1 Tax=Galerina marginata (strain CBS 339.88) TaxID=685588 RepID=A0A067SSK2_GALM3|nr:hypothetical protein GALMADRAFT_142699 [Galerina marginata CBS 339.88]
MITTTTPDLDSFTNIPNELILCIFSYLDLRGLIAARGVSREWGTFVAITDIAPVRKDMLDFYDYLLTSPLFFKTRPWVLANLKHFNRQAYIAKLTRQYYSLPEEFRLWVLEWPARAVVACSWPGLPRKRYTGQYADNINVIRGTLDSIPPSLHPHLRGRRQSKGGTYSWHLDQREHMNGKVFHAGMSDVTLEGNLESDQLQYDCDSLEPGWIAYQRSIWKDVEEEADNCVKTGGRVREFNDVPVDKSASAFPEAIELGTNAWLRRNEPYTQGRLRLTNDALLAQFT